MHFRCTWDERKRREDRSRHGFDFAEVPAVFAGPTLTIEDDRFTYSERRYMTLGFLRELVVSIIHTETPGRIHVISFRQATRREESLLFQSLAD